MKEILVSDEDYEKLATIAKAMGISLSTNDKPNRPPSFRFQTDGKGRGRMERKVRDGGINRCPFWNSTFENWPVE